MANKGQRTLTPSAEVFSSVGASGAGELLLSPAAASLLAPPADASIGAAGSISTLAAWIDVINRACLAYSS